jgi:hypothetical protein
LLATLKPQGVSYRLAIRPGLELFLQGFCNPMDDMHPSVAILTTAEALLSYTAVVQCGRMKKFSWVLKKNAEIVHALENEIGCVCQRGLAGAILHPKKRCRIGVWGGSFGNGFNR